MEKEITITIGDCPDRLGKYWTNKKQKKRIYVDNFDIVDNGVEKPRQLLKNGKLTTKAKEYINYKPIELAILRDFLEL